MRLQLSHRLRLVAAGFLFASAAGSPIEAADRPVGAGLQVSLGSEKDFAIGARAFVSLERLLRGLEAAGSFDLFFPGDDHGVDLDYWEVSARVAYRFERPGRALAPYLGVGVHMAQVKATVTALGAELSGDETQGGLDLLGGVLFRLKGVRLYTEARVEIGGGEQVVATVGVRF
jgi:opacity protein-like surface antigen